jgi:hypothetical protein
MFLLKFLQNQLHKNKKRTIFDNKVQAQFTVEACEFPQKNRKGRLSNKNISNY